MDLHNFLGTGVSETPAGSDIKLPLCAKGFSGEGYNMGWAFSLRQCISVITQNSPELGSGTMWTECFSRDKCLRGQWFEGCR